MISSRHRLVFGALLALAGALWLASGPRALAASGSDIVTAARLGVYQNKTRFVLEMTGKVSHQLGYETGPDRIVIEFPALSWHPRAMSGSSKSGLIAAYRFASKGNKATLTLDLRGPAEPKEVFFIPPQDGHDWRFVMDLGAMSKGEFAKRAEHAKPQAEARAAPEPRQEPKAEPKSPEPKPPEPKLAETPPPPPAPAPIQAAKPQSQAQPQAQKAPSQPPLRQPEPNRLAQAEVVAPPAPAVVQMAPAPPAAKPPAPVPQAAPAPAPEAKTAALSPSQTLPSPAAKPTPPPEAAKPTPPPEAKPEAPHKHVVVIDPGHGGVDPGAQAADGTKEKDVVFKVAEALAKKLEHSGRYTAVLTRSGDSFLKLSERVGVARQAHAELFVSLHADTLPDSPDVSGTSVYTLSAKATDKEAEALAGKENRADIIAGVDLSHEPEDVTHILIDLAQRDTANRSVGFAHSVAVALASWTPTVKNASRRAGFRVLKAPDVPSVLVELGYLSNANDLARITSDSWIDQFTDAMLASADHQFHEGEAKVQRVDAGDRASVQ